MSQKTVYVRRLKILKIKKRTTREELLEIKKKIAEMLNVHINDVNFTYDEK